MSFTWCLNISIWLNCLKNPLKECFKKFFLKFSWEMLTNGCAYLLYIWLLKWVNPINLNEVSYCIAPQTIFRALFFFFNWKTKFIYVFMLPISEFQMSACELWGPKMLNGKTHPCRNGQKYTITKMPGLSQTSSRFPSLKIKMTPRSLQQP